MPHAFSDHQLCEDHCKKKNDPNHAYTYFKDGICLSDNTLEDKLMKISALFIRSAPQLGHCGSSQNNEFLNSTICYKHPKFFFLRELRIALLQSSFWRLTKKPWL